MVFFLKCFSAVIEEKEENKLEVKRLLLLKIEIVNESWVKF